MLQIRIKNATQNNLKDISINIPHHKFIVVSGISGSGKSSLAFDIIAQEGRRQYLETIPAFARQFSGKISKSDVGEISGLFPVISIEQSKTTSLSTSTLGTLSNLYDYLRLLFARFGEAEKEIKLSRSLFSFNSALGACPKCKGLGLEEHISTDKLIADPNKTLREGALVPSQPNGYIMYSQITINVLNQVCEHHGFNVDIPWNKLTEEQKDIVLNGSDKIKIPFGKHSLESRLKWKALKAKPREEGYYKGMLPIMEDILHRDRNKNILRFVEAIKCKECNGKRLNKKARSVRYNSKTIDYLSEIELTELKTFFEQIDTQSEAEKNIQEQLIQELSLFCNLGMGHLSLSRTANSLKAGEKQRIRIINQLSAQLSNVLYVFDEPSIGMHPRDNQTLLKILRELVNNGNTVIVVEHDFETIRQADWLIEVGPEAGINGGKILYNGITENFLKATPSTPTQRALAENPETKYFEKNYQKFNVENCHQNNLKNISVSFKKAAINLICGVPGSGKTSLVYKCLLPQLQNFIYINQSPIGRTPRSNPATYTGLSNYIRDLFAAQPAAKEKLLTKSHFSFNTKGGRCEHCLGAGKIQIGMHYMGNVDLPCEICNGKRFKSEILKVKYLGKSISDVYNLSIREALSFFAKEKMLIRYLSILDSLGLGYIKLGQSSTTLSGGEAQRIKLAASLVKQHHKESWYILNEPTTGLHHADTKRLISALRALSNQGHTIVCIEHQQQFMQAADHILELGPGSGKYGGEIIFEGVWQDFIISKLSPTAKALRETNNKTIEPKKTPDIPQSIILRNVTTNNLKGINIEIPKNQITVLTGLSGSGKSSLAFDTLFAESQSRFSESLSTYSRSFIKQANHAEADAFLHLNPAIAINRKNLPSTPRSTVGTLTKIYEKYRFLFSRLAQQQGVLLSAKEFSFNHELGACSQCGGLGEEMKGDPEKLVPDNNKSIEEGALTHNSIIRYYGNPDSQFVAVLKAVAQANQIDLTKPFAEFTTTESDIIFNGTGDKIWETSWTFKTKTKTGTQLLKMKWKGFAGLIEEEYHRSEHNKSFAKIGQMMHSVTCQSCHGNRLKSKALAIQLAGKNIAGLSALSIKETKIFFEQLITQEANPIVEFSYQHIKKDLDSLIKLGLGHLSIDRRSSTLSGGEGQRLRLAQQLSGSLQGMTFVLDEPTIGLHQKDIGKLITIIDELKAKGNTFLIVEHDKEIINRADFVIEMGPGSGKNGGEIVASGTLAEFIKNKKAITPNYLKDIHLPKAIKTNLQQNAFGFKGVNIYNLKNRNFSFVADGIIALTGVSGSGKSTLMHKVIYPCLTKNKPVNAKSFFNNAGFNQLLEIDQKMITGSRHQSVFSYTGLMDIFAKIYADTKTAKEKGLGKAAFSYTGKEGKCTYCNGVGEIKISMDFMDDVWNTCDVCKGSRYSVVQQNIRIQDKSIADLQQLSLEELMVFVENIDPRQVKKATDILQQLLEMGLGHLSVGQSTTSLSGGEAQRLKMSSVMVQAKQDKILFLLDEPSSGLHYADLDKLITIFNSLVRQGHTVLFIEHNPYLISIAHQVIEL
ncbi:MAG: ATP-binding cassette domain-containing protein [Bacteroidales bacterium]|nr:ATP-binding cassette domain-containing protein [Bacteroidales bacterium]